MSPSYASKRREERRPPSRDGPPDWKERGMLDVLMVTLSIVAFGALFALIAGLERV